VRRWDEKTHSAGVPAAGVPVLVGSESPNRLLS